MEKYTIDELEAIQDKASKIMAFALGNDKGKLPRAFDFIGIIARNIDICKRDNYNSAAELTLLIQKDWRACMESHAGLMEYYFVNDNYEIRCELNSTFQQMVVELDKIISRIGR